MRADVGVTPARRDGAFYEERRHQRLRRARLRRRALIGVAAAAVVAALGTGVGFAGSSDRIAAGVSVAGVDVGGKTAEEAKRTLERRAAALAAQPVVFTGGEQRFLLTAAQLGVAADWDAAVEQALERGDGFILFRGFKRLGLRVGGANVEPSGVADAATVEQRVRRLAKAIDLKAAEAAITLDGLEPVVSPAQTGRRLDRDRAAAVIVAALAALERTGSVALPVAVAEPEVTAAALQPVAAQVRTVLSAPVALAHGKTRLSIGPAKLSKLLLLPSGGSKELAIGGEAAERYLSGLAKAIDRPPLDAGFTLTGGGRPRVVAAREGRTLDIDATRTALLAAALVAPPGDRTAPLAVETAQPKRTTEEAKAMGIVGVVGSYTTTYGGDPNRIHNVQLVSKLIDDHLIPPGALFSFNETTGERNADKGFLEAPVIINGELQTGLGGGVCQVSTTVFNAAFEAGLSIEARTNHALYISHYPLGRDATVNFPDTDLVFKNDTGHWLWLRAFVDSSSLTINLYGTPVDREVVVETSPLEVTGKPPVKKVEEPDRLVGEKWVEDPGEPARSVSVRRIVYAADGSVLYDTVWYSSYRAEPKLVHVGTKSEPKEPKPPKDDDSQGGGSQGGGATQPAETQPPPETEPPAETEPPPATTGEPPAPPA